MFPIQSIGSAVPYKNTTTNQHLPESVKTPPKNKALRGAEHPHTARILNTPIVQKIEDFESYPLGSALVGQPANSPYTSSETCGPTIVQSDRGGKALKAGACYWAQMLYRDFAFTIQPSDVSFHISFLSRTNNIAGNTHSTVTIAIKNGPGIKFGQYMGVLEGAQKRSSLSLPLGIWYEFRLSVKMDTKKLSVFYRTANTLAWQEGPGLQNIDATGTDGLVISDFSRFNLLGLRTDTLSSDGGYIDDIYLVRGEDYSVLDTIRGLVPSTTSPSILPSSRPSTLPSRSPSLHPSPAPSPSPSWWPSFFPSMPPSRLPSRSPSSAPSPLPSQIPSESPSPAPSFLPSWVPSFFPSVTPSRSPSLFPSPAPSPSPSWWPSFFPSMPPSRLPSRSPSSAPSPLPSQIPSESPSPAPSFLPSWVPSFFPSVTPSRLPSRSPSSAPSPLPSQVPSESPSPAPSFLPSWVPSFFPSMTPSRSPSRSPSSAPSPLPSQIPSESPSPAPSFLPSWVPSFFPSVTPSRSPSLFPSPAPSPSPSWWPSFFPSMPPSRLPSRSPSSAPSPLPSQIPSESPSPAPSFLPSWVPSFFPSMTPSRSPSRSPSSAPSRLPSQVPSESPSPAPSFLPSWVPSFFPSVTPSRSPSLFPSQAPSPSPSWWPSFFPSMTPSRSPSRSPSSAPSPLPSQVPSESPSLAPSFLPSWVPSFFPSVTPSRLPSLSPSPAPSRNPTRYAIPNALLLDIDAYHAGKAIDHSPRRSDGIIVSTKRSNTPEKSLFFGPNHAQYVVFSDANFPTESLPSTQTAWIKTTAFNQNSLISYYGNALADQGRGLSLLSNGKIRFSSNPNDNDQACISSLSIQQNDWTFIAGVFDGYQQKIYINGRLDSSCQLPWNTSLLAGYIGAETTCTTHAYRPWTGLIGEVTVFDNALTATDISQLFANADHYLETYPTSSPTSVPDLTKDLNDANNTYLNQTVLVVTLIVGGAVLLGCMACIFGLLRSYMSIKYDNKK